MANVSEEFRFPSVCEVDLVFRLSRFALGFMLNVSTELSYSSRPSNRQFLLPTLPIGFTLTPLPTLEDTLNCIAFDSSTAFWAERFVGFKESSLDTGFKSLKIGLSP